MLANYESTDFFRRGTMLKCKFFLLGFFVFFILHAQSVLAFYVGFDNNYFAVRGAYATQTASIVNDSNKILPVQIEMYRRTMSPTGEEVIEPCEDFLIVPKQLLVQPNDEALVTISWVGTATPNMELAYRLKFKELALPQTEEEFKAEGEVKTSTAKLDFLTSYMKAVFVMPPPPFTAKSDIIVESISVTKDAKTKTDKMMLTLYNKGNVHDVIKKGVVTFSTPDRTIAISPPEAEFIALLANSRSRMIMAWPVDLPKDADIKATVGMKKP